MALSYHNPIFTKVLFQQTPKTKKKTKAYEFPYATPLQVAIATQLSIYNNFGLKINIISNNQFTIIHTALKNCN